MRVEVWTALVKTPDSRYTTVTVHPTEEAAADSLWENFVHDQYEDDDGITFPKREDTDLDTESWVSQLESHFSLDITLDSHIVEDAVEVGEGPRMKPGFEGAAIAGAVNTQQEYESWIEGQ